MSSNRKSPTKDAMRLVREAFDPDALVRICEASDFTRYAPRIELDPHKDGRKRFFHYIDNGSDILAVAHLDHVQADGTCQVVNTAAGPLAVSGALDDRLGAYVILELLPKLGITCDWLLTTDEELGASTAEDFDALKQYNWIVEFDRGGTDVVMYQYETKALVELVECSGARVGIGSFSDISSLEHLGCAAFNWGVAYADYHGPRSHAWLEDTFRMVARFMKFHRANAGKFLAHDALARYEDVNIPGHGDERDLDWWPKQTSHVSDEEMYQDWLKAADTNDRTLYEYGPPWGDDDDADVLELR